MKLPADTFPFLSELAANNNREWFNAQKPRFKALQDEMIGFIDALIGQMIPLEPLLVSVEAKDCLFRIYKDARFSKGQPPYKTHFGIHIVSSGKRSDFGRAGFYLHIEPNACMIAGGAHAPSPVWLKQIRQEILTNGETLEEILADKTFKKYFGALRGDQLSRPPVGFAKDAAHMDLLRHKTLWVQHDFADDKLTGTGFMAYYHKVFEAYLPFQQFLNQA
jgi:uncharacterized protein (TIGR02453 family)